MATLEQRRIAAHAAVLDGLSQGQSLRAIESAVRRSDVRGVYSPDIAMLEVVVAALDVMQVGPDHRVSTAQWRERYLPELTFRNRHAEVQRMVYAFQTAAAFRTGLVPDVLDDTYSWSQVELWPYATRAAVMTVRAAADGKDLVTVCTQVAAAVRQLELE